MSSKLHKVMNCTDNDRRVDVIFMHGLGGDPFDTWQKEGEDSFWPKWIGEELPEAGVWSLEYAASPSRQFGAVRRWWKRKERGAENIGRAMPLPERANDVLDLLVQERIGKRPSMFVCHSLGGLLAKKVLSLASQSPEDSHRAVYESARGVLFLATPHHGAQLASLADAFRGLFGATASIEDLREHDAHLIELYNWYRNNSNAITTRTYYESQDVYGFRIVREGSAQAGVGWDAVKLDKDHLSIAKPANRESRVYRATKDLLRDACGVGSEVDSSVAVTRISCSPLDELIKQKIREVLTTEDIEGMQPHFQQQIEKYRVETQGVELVEWLCGGEIAFDQAVSWLGIAASERKKAIKRENPDDWEDFKDRIQDALGWLLLRSVAPGWLERHSQRLSSEHRVRITLSTDHSSCLEVAISGAMKRSARFDNTSGGVLGDRSVALGGEAGFEPVPTYQEILAAIWKKAVSKTIPPRFGDKEMKKLKAAVRSWSLYERPLHLGVELHKEGSAIGLSEVDRLQEDFPQLQIIMIRLDGETALILDDYDLDSMIHTFFKMVLDEAPAK